MSFQVMIGLTYNDIDLPMLTIYPPDYHVATASDFATEIRKQHGTKALVLHVPRADYHLFHFVSDGELDVGSICRANGGDGIKTNARYIKRNRTLRLTK
jgi:hypothetical protein